MVVVTGGVQIRWWRGNITMYLCSCNPQCYPSNSHHREIISLVWSRAIIFKATLKSKLCFQLAWGGVNCVTSAELRGFTAAKVLLYDPTAIKLVLDGEYRVLQPKRHFKGSMGSTKLTHCCGAGI